MSGDARKPPEDVLTFRRVPTGVTGIPRLKEWDAVVLVEVPELEASALAELELDAPAGDEATARAEEPVPREAVERLTAELDARLDRPYEALAVRRGRRRWAAGARGRRAGDTIELPEGTPGGSVEVVRAPDGGLEVLVDGEPTGAETAPLADVVAELDRRGRELFESFVARADRAEKTRWHVTVDPL